MANRTPRMQSRPEPAQEIDLDARIFAAEQGVIERDERLLHNVRALRERLKRSALRGLVASVAGFAGAMLLSRTAPVRDAAPRTPRPAWASLLLMLWPWLPLNLHRRVSPATASLAVDLLLPLLRWRRRAAPERAAHVDLRRYAGVWIEVARMARAGVPDGSAIEFCPHPHGLVVRRFKGTGLRRIEHGRARVRDAGRNTKLEVSYAPGWLRWLPPVWTQQWILDVDDSYAHAVVGSPDRRSLWLLSRDPEPSFAEMQRMLRIAQQRGYDVARVRATSPP